MTRKDFELIAEALGASLAECNTERVRVIASGVAFRLRRTNPRFDYERFTAAVVSAANGRILAAGEPPPRCPTCAGVSEAVAGLDAYHHCGSCGRDWSR